MLIVQSYNNLPGFPMGFTVQGQQLWGREEFILQTADED
jgi:hypothetical protein